MDCGIKCLVDVKWNGGAAAFFSHGCMPILSLWPCDFTTACTTTLSKRRMWLCMIVVRFELTARRKPFLAIACYCWVGCPGLMLIDGGTEDWREIVSSCWRTEKGRRDEEEEDALPISSSSFLPTTTDHANDNLGAAPPKAPSSPVFCVRVSALVKSSSKCRATLAELAHSNACVHTWGTVHNG